MKRYHALLIAGGLYLCIANIVWVFSDTRPPFWDMAYHQTKAIHVYETIRNNNFIAALQLIPQQTGFYPPLLHTIIAIFYALFGISNRAGVLANLPAIGILLFSTYSIGRRLLPPMNAAMGAVLVGFYPILLWISRETLVDYWLTSMVALAIWFLLRTENFSKRTESALFGFVCGLGMLTKWTFWIFPVLPALWIARKNWKNAALSSIIALIISAYWYFPQWRSLAEFFSINSAGGIAEGDPARFSWQALIFYIRALEGYQLFLPLFLLFIAGLIFLIRRFDSAWIPIILWIVGGWCGFLLFQNKDPRYTAPLLPAIALISAMALTRHRFWIPVLSVFLILQHHLVSFGIPQLPERVVLLKGIQGNLSWDWNLYSQTLFQVMGPPAREDWKIEQVLKKITQAQNKPLKLGIVPSIPRFDPEAFEFTIARYRYSIEISRLQQWNNGMFAGQDYLLISEGDQGHAAFYSHDLGRINQYVFDHPEYFRMIDRFQIPSGQIIRLYQINFL
jgi:4-amino-4-deoxy-L-arabinose transferase-like glycosyltransferase